jgi:hypothetical protein|uniref:Uncharacterized protein n=1 Tax=Picea glauca TaxID=3330 RepID=A0A117NID4_PICGL|nr:hypothetical protein ABT39_MTgene2927 [Picea glauca]
MLHYKHLTSSIYQQTPNLTFVSYVAQRIRLALALVGFGLAYQVIPVVAMFCSSYVELRYGACSYNVLVFE